MVWSNPFGVAHENGREFDISTDPQIVLLAPLFDPSAKTYNNVTLVVDSTCLSVPGSFKVTVDNVKVTTKNALIPFAGNSSATFEFLGDALSITERGVAEHIGSFEANYVLPYATTPIGTAEITAANGDKLMGTFIYGYQNEFGVRLEQGTGRFNGAVGSYRGLITSLDEMTATMTATLQGGLSQVGSSRN